MSILRDRLLAACDANGVTQKSVTALAEHRDPYRLDTPAIHLGRAIRCRQSLGEQPAPDFPA
jgi:hypothetical protein